jgi:hypothetical protein
MKIKALMTLALAQHHFDFTTAAKLIITNNKFLHFLQILVR